jgi:uncharacterized protein (DUF1800 family)
MAVNTSLAPIAPTEFDYAHAQHLLNRAGFGGPPSQIASLVEMGLDKAVDLLVDYQAVTNDAPTFTVDSEILRPPNDEERRAMETARKTNNTADMEKFRAARLKQEYLDRGQMSKIETWWMERMVATPRPMEEKLTLFWHGHFASNQRTVRDSYLMYQQNQMLRKNANGSFANLAGEIIRDPAMIRFLNNDSNRKSHPNENLGRELMELFTLGQGAYTEDDIKEGARALTGYAVEDNAFQFRRPMHDAGTKNILGQKGMFDGEDFVRIILARPQCGPFVAYKMYRHLVADIDEKMSPETRGVILALGKILADNKYEVRPMLKTLLKSQHFYSSSITGNLIKSPVQLLVGTVRVLQTPMRDARVLTEAMQMMGQQLFEPPSVAGWDGGRAWINTSTLFVRQNLATYLITGKLPYDDNWSRDKIDYDPMTLLAGVKDASITGAIDHLMATLLGDYVTMERRQNLIDYAHGRKLAVNSDSLIALLLLITAMPEYQLC